jgi:hypothetical protein
MIPVSATGQRAKPVQLGHDWTTDWTAQHHEARRGHEGSIYQRVTYTGQVSSSLLDTPIRMDWTDTPLSLERVSCPARSSADGNGRDDTAFKADYQRRLRRALRGFLANAPQRERRDRWRGFRR